MFSLTEVGAPDLPFFIGDFMAAFMVALFDDKKQACANVRCILVCILHK